MDKREGLERLRSEGWAVAIHNDYWLAGERKTFWLLTHRRGVWVKGEGATDDEALALCCKDADAWQSMGRLSPDARTDIASASDGGGGRCPTCDGLGSVGLDADEPCHDCDRTGVAPVQAAKETGGEDKGLPLKWLHLASCCKTNGLLIDGKPFDAAGALNEVFEALRAANARLAEVTRAAESWRDAITDASDPHCTCKQCVAVATVIVGLTAALSGPGTGEAPDPANLPPEVAKQVVEALRVFAQVADDYDDSEDDDLQVLVDVDFLAPRLRLSSFRSARSALSAAAKHMEG